MICAKSDKKILPKETIFSLSTTTMVCSHSNVQDDTGSYALTYVTPLAAMKVTDDVVPGTAEAAVNPELVKNGIVSFVKMFPHLKDKLDQIQWLVYAGYKAVCLAS
jgi:hypothetical protein